MTEPWWISLIKAALIVNLVMVAFAYTTWLERKLLGRMQNRYGPNRAGPFGLLQPFADLIKLVRKESFFPVAAQHPLYIAAPIVSMFTALAAFAVIPFGAGWQIWHYHVNGEIANVSIALILIFALGSLGVYGAIVGGWASESKYSLLGAMRTCAQLVSYEVSLALSVLGVVLMGQSLNLVDIVNKQGATIWFFIPQLAGLMVFFFAMIAETSRPHFDLPEAELSEQDARSRGIRNGEEITIRSNGTSVTLRARLSRELRPGVVRVPEDFASDLQPSVEISK